MYYMIVREAGRESGGARRSLSAAGKVEKVCGRV